jgi:hypothetical protein
MKNDGQQDYFVIRDQFQGPPLDAHYCLHVLGEQCEHRGNVIDFEGLRLTVAAPERFQFSRHDWMHGNGGLEATKGIRLSVRGAGGEFITVLQPRPVKCVTQCKLTLKEAVYRPKYNKRTDETEKHPRDLIVTLDYDGDRLYRRAAVDVPDFNRALHTGQAERRSDEIRLSIDLGTDRRAEGGEGSFRLKLDRQGTKLSGAFTGSYRGQPREGQVSGQMGTNVLSSQGHWVENVKLTPTKPIPGGVQVGKDRIVFAGGIDAKEDTTYVTITRDDQPVLQLTGADVDLDRFQGEIGLYVPDTGYPFGQIPDWLIRQRVKREDTSER